VLQHKWYQRLRRGESNRWESMQREGSSLIVVHSHKEKSSFVVRFCLEEEVLGLIHTQRREIKNVQTQIGVEVTFFGYKPLALSSKNMFWLERLVD